MTTSSTSGVDLNAFTEVASKDIHKSQRKPQPKTKQPRLRRGMMMRLPLCLLQILFLTWVTSIEHYWVNLRERPSP